MRPEPYSYASLNLFLPQFSVDSEDTITEHEHGRGTLNVAQSLVNEILAGEMRKAS